jgi:NitT/TauT family transport system substrate-binding protein
LIVCTFCLVSCKGNSLTKLRVAEVAHSVFYAPQYVAIELGYFEDEGLEIELINSNGADKVTAALLSKDVQIGLQGPEPTIYLYNSDQQNYLINFAQLTRTDGSFIFGREKIENFNLSMMLGKTILGGRKGGVPEMTLEYVLKQHGLKVVRDQKEVKPDEVNIRTDVAFGAMAGSFLAGEGDFTTLFEPTATELVLSNQAHLLCSVGELVDEVPYTSYSTTLNYYQNNQDILEKFVRAIYRGYLFIEKSTDEEVAKVILNQFPDSNIKDLTEVVKRYRNINAWAKTPVFNKDGFERLMDIMEEAGELDKRVEFSNIVDIKIAEKVVNDSLNEN